ncbi:MAG: hypothetical protein U0Q15_08955 [Kineosporiaceae bacterium]
MRKRIARSMAGLVMGVGMLGAVGGTAWAAMSGSIPNFSTNGAAFSGGTYRFDPWPCTSACYQGTWSGWHYSGKLADTKDDGHTIFMHGKVDGYGWGPNISWRGGANTSTPVSQWLIGGADPVQTGQLEICVNRGVLPDYCAKSVVISRH